MSNKIYTIGFTKKSAEEFFSLLRNENINTLIDVRLNNISQLAGFAKKNDLTYFLKELCEIDYVYEPLFTPTKDILKPYKNGESSWIKYEDQFLNLLAQRNVERKISKDILKNSCLLCSEHEPHLCHRRLVVDYLNEHSDFNLDVKHLF